VTARAVVRASGKTPGTEAAEVAAQEATEPLEEAVLPEERVKVFERLGFARMRTSWSDDHSGMMQRIRQTVHGRVFDLFPDAFSIMEEVWRTVRVQAVDPKSGELMVDEYGLPRWRKTAGGAYVENWALFGTAQREQTLFKITTLMFEWEQRASDAWGEAMFAKALWAEEFAHYFDDRNGKSKATIDACNADATMRSAESRYFAVFASYLSRQADALVKSMDRIARLLVSTTPR
jgi:hypothetical protein